MLKQFQVITHGCVEVVFASSFYVSNSLVVFEIDTGTEDRFEFGPILAIPSSGVTRIEYIGDHTE